MHGTDFVEKVVFSLALREDCPSDIIFRPSKNGQSSILELSNNTDLGGHVAVYEQGSKRGEITATVILGRLPLIGVDNNVELVHGWTLYIAFLSNSRNHFRIRTEQLLYRLDTLVLFSRLVHLGF
ncbi:hypothetical protein A4G99_13870 [Haladaptatus sp. R4]|nr:hypothetical protein A4G99_13870 [Haladaptatus sp. R4]